MHFNTLFPNIFYSDIKVGLKLFVECLGLTVVYEDLKGEQPFCIAKRDSIKVYLIQSHEFAIKDRPEIRIEVDDIEALYHDVKTKWPELLHPNSKAVTLKPWGAKEFALKDESDVCVIIQQFV